MTDHLGTPRAVYNQNGTLVWKWESLAQPFGKSLPDEDLDDDSQKLLKAPDIWIHSDQA